MADFAFAETGTCGIATVLAQGGGAGAVAAALGLAPGAGARRAIRGDGLALLPTAPGQWLAVHEDAAPGWAEGLAEVLAGAGDVVDQSSAYVAFRVTGADARRGLQKGLPLDLGVGAFGVDSVAVSAIAHIGVIVWCDGPERFWVAVFRSYAESFHQWLHVTGAAL